MAVQLHLAVQDSTSVRTMRQDAARLVVATNSLQTPRRASERRPAVSVSPCIIVHLWLSMFADTTSPAQHVAGAVSSVARKGQHVPIASSPNAAAKDMLHV